MGLGTTPHNTEHKGEIYPHEKKRQ